MCRLNDQRPMINEQRGVGAGVWHRTSRIMPGKVVALSEKAKCQMRDAKYCVPVARLWGERENTTTISERRNDYAAEPPAFAKRRLRIREALRAALRGLYRFEIVRTTSYRFGPAVWRLPRELRRRMVAERKWSLLPGVTLRRVGQPEDVRQFTPVFADGGLNIGQRMAASRSRLQHPAVTRLPGAWLVGKHAAPVTLDGRILLSPFQDSPLILGLEPQEDLLTFLRAGKFRQRPAAATWCEVFPLVSRLDPNYFHWMVESCGQLQSLQAYSFATGIRPKILIRAGGNSYIRQSLELLGYGSEILQWPEGSPPVFVAGVILASLPSNRVACSPGALRWLRGKFLAAAGAGGTPAERNAMSWRKIYIRRKPGGWRSVANDDEVCSRLEAMGFETARPEGLTLAEQIRLFSEAEIIVGMHGAGLTNLLFAPDAAVLELTGEYGGGEFLTMASGLGNPYGSLRCATAGDDIRVDVGMLAQGVNALLRDLERRNLERGSGQAAFPGGIRDARGGQLVSGAVQRAFTDEDPGVRN